MSCICLQGFRLAVSGLLFSLHVQKQSGGENSIHTTQVYITGAQAGAKGNACRLAWHVYTPQRTALPLQTSSTNPTHGLRAFGKKHETREQHLRLRQPKARPFIRKLREGPLQLPASGASQPATFTKPSACKSTRHLATMKLTFA